MSKRQIKLSGRTSAASRVQPAKPGRLPRYARLLLGIFAEATSPLRAEEVMRILRQRTTLRSQTTGLLLIDRLKKAGLLQYADVTRASAEAALAIAKRILDSLDDDYAPEIPSVTRYEVTESGRTYLRRRAR